MIIMLRACFRRTRKIEQRVVELKNEPINKIEETKKEMADDKGNKHACRIKPVPDPMRPFRCQQFLFNTAAIGSITKRKGAANASGDGRGSRGCTIEDDCGR